MVVALIPVLVLNAEAALPPTPAGWTLVFSDDFGGAANTGLNTSNWLYDTGTSYPGGAANWGTGEVETMTTSTANVAAAARRNQVSEEAATQYHGRRVVDDVRTSPGASRRCGPLR